MVLVVDDICQRGNAAAVGKRHRVDLVVGNSIGLAIGKGKLTVLGGHQRVAGDLQHPQRTALDIKLAVQDHIRHAVVGAGVAVRASLFKVDAADQNVDHIALIFLGGLDLLHDGGGTFCRADAVLHLVHKAHTVHHHTGDHGNHPHHNGKGQPQRGLFLLFAAARCIVPAQIGLCCIAGRRGVLRPGSAAGVLLRGSLRGTRRLIRAAERAVCIDMAWRLAHAFISSSFSLLCRVFYLQTCHILQYSMVRQNLQLFYPGMAETIFNRCPAFHPSFCPLCAKISS